MTPEQLKAKFPNASSSFLKANSAALGAMESPEHPKLAPALVRDTPAKQSRKGGVGVCVEIIGLRRRILDSDNFTAGAKPLRDAIAYSLAIDDGSNRIRFECGQVQTFGPEGTIVRISWL